MQTSIMINRLVLFKTQSRFCTITDSSLNCIPNNTTDNSSSSSSSLHNIMPSLYPLKSSNIKILFIITNSSNSLSKFFNRRLLLKVLIKILNINLQRIAAENSFKLCKANTPSRITTFNTNNSYSSNNHLHHSKNISSHNTITWQQENPCIRGRDLRVSLWTAIIWETICLTLVKEPRVILEMVGNRENILSAICLHKHLSNLDTANSKRGK